MLKKPRRPATKFSNSFPAISATTTTRELPINKNNVNRNDIQNKSLVSRKTDGKKSQIVNKCTNKSIIAEKKAITVTTLKKINRI